MAISDGKPTIMFGIPSTLGDECVELGGWLWTMGQWLGAQGMAAYHGSQRSSRILLNRNSFVEHALSVRADYLLMVDPDMVPDMYARLPVATSSNIEAESSCIPGQKPFLPLALQVLKDYPFSVVAAPACGDPPKRQLNVYPIDPQDPTSKPATHEYAEQRVREGNVVEKVAAIGTGLIIFPLAILHVLKRPFFDDVYNPDKTALDRSQDVYFTSCCYQAGINVFCTWGSFAGHRKTVTVGCPGIDTLFAPRPAPKNESPEWQPPITLKTG